MRSEIAEIRGKLARMAELVAAMDPNAQQPVSGRMGARSTDSLRLRSAAEVFWGSSATSVMPFSWIKGHVV